MRWFPTKSPQPRWPRQLPVFLLIPGSGEPQSVPWPDRHNSPNLNAQLEQTDIDTIICSAIDSEPRLRLNAAFAARRWEFVAKGISELKQRTGAKRACIVVESRSPHEWVSPIRQISGATIVELPNDYPQNDPVMLLRTLTGRELKPGALPSEEGVVLVDAAGAATVGGFPSVPLAVLDHVTGRPVYLEAAAELSLADALSAAKVRTALRQARGGDLLRDRPVKMGKRVGTEELCIHLLTPLEPADIEACIRCGWCAQVCPTLVKPAWVLEAVQRKSDRLARTSHYAACIECGLCDQVCPAHLPLLAAIQRLKSDDRGRWIH